MPHTPINSTHQMHYLSNLSLGLQDLKSINQYFKQTKWAAGQNSRFQDLGNQSWVSPPQMDPWIVWCSELKMQLTYLGMGTDLPGCTNLVPNYNAFQIEPCLNSWRRIQAPGVSRQHDLVHRRSSKMSNLNGEQHDLSSKYATARMQRFKVSKWVS